MPIFPGRTRRQLGVAATAAVLAGGLTACVGSGGTPSVTVGKAVDTIGFAALDVAQAKGYFAREGVQVKLTGLAPPAAKVLPVKIACFTCVPVES